MNNLIEYKIDSIGRKIPIHRRPYKKWSQEQKDRLKESRRKQIESGEFAESCRKGVESRKKSLIQANEKRSKTLKEFWSSKEGNEKKVQAQLKRNLKKKEIYDKQKLSLRKFYDSPEGRLLSKQRTVIPWNKGLSATTNEKIKRVADIRKGVKRSDEMKQQMSRSHIGLKQSQETVDKRKEKMKVIKQEKEYWDKLQKGLKLRPNKFEQKIAKFLPSSFQYTGDFNPNGMFHFVDGRNKNADFTYFPTRDYVIECNGDYWHGKDFIELTPEDHEKDIVKNYEKIGVTCLVIWEHELKDLESLKIKIQKFISLALDSKEVKELN